MNDVRCIFRPGEPARPRETNNLPPPVRRDLADFLEGALLRPLHMSVASHRQGIEQAVDTMTLAERVFIEIEMSERRTATHSFDYDPMRSR